MTAPTVRSFDRARANPVQFMLDGELFEAVPDIPAKAMADLAGKATQVGSTTDTTAQWAAIVDIMQSLLVPDSRARFDTRLSDPANPITLQQLIDLFTWLMGEVYGGRPTMPPSPSPATPPDGGTVSTDGAPPTTSTSSGLPGIAI